MRGRGVLLTQRYINLVGFKQNLQNVTIHSKEINVLKCEREFVQSFESQDSTSRKNFVNPAGLVTITFTSPEIFLLALKIDDIKCVRYANSFNNRYFQIVT